MKTLLTSFCVVLLSFTTSDVHKEMFVKDEVSIEKYRLVFFSPSGGTFFRGTTNKELIHFLGDYNNEELELNCTKKTKGNSVTVNFNMIEKSQGFSDVFSSTDKSYKNEWDVYLKKDKPSELEVALGYGESNFNLSSLALKKLKVESLHASVRFNYSIGQPNKVKMDSMVVSSELGDITFDGPELSYARHVSIDNSYGNSFINIKGKPVDRFVADVYVGTGKVLISLPSAQVPVKVVVKEKHLASLILPEEFKKTTDRIYENTAYQKSKIDPIVFNLHGSLGEVIFQKKQ